MVHIASHVQDIGFNNSLYKILKSKCNTHEYLVVFTDM